ncbi:NAD(P)-binding domain-containing protein [Streptomyces sp. RFCAC02]|uniref:NADPH-dependent F420 reductase n=1 Tax=Streptomyces sp. RFCAC02 TaxID=2499143 RepID=UPI001020F7D3|nr:NAD(P)-binding domain-containing protein [Streptomyces sp. RFCAC02]
MRIGILGAGSLSTALAARWRTAGHDVVAGGRTPARTGHGFAAAAAHGTDAVVVAVPDHAALAVLAEAGAGDGALRGRAVIDCTVPLVPGTVTLSTAGGPSMAERIAAAAPGAGVVKAFTFAPADVWTLDTPVFDGDPLGVPLCGDDPAALATAGRLVTDLGAVPLPAGGLERAGLAEATAAFLIGLWATGADARTALPRTAGTGAARPTLGRRPAQSAPGSR